MNKPNFWFIIGSQFLYGPGVLETVDKRGAEMVETMSEGLPYNLVYKATVKTAREITALMREANADENCCGVITWCHTFSPSKMWIEGLHLLQKPLCHLATQYNRNIPNEAIDMDFMNLNQAAHGDREHGFIATRMRLARKVIVGFWQDATLQSELGDWMRAAYGAVYSRSLKLIRFGDNMREVAVTEGDKVHTHMQLGWTVDTWPVGHLVSLMNDVSEAEIDEKMAEYASRYDMPTDNIDSVRYQARAEIAMRKILVREGAMAFSNTFEDLYGMEQLPGLASQNMMMDGYGYGGEGDWKVSAMTAILKAMGKGKDGASLFMEDYTYDLEPGNELSLGAHMLEVCPSIAVGKAKIEVHPLGIGGKQPPARLVFEGEPGEGIVISLIDMGGRLRLIIQDITVIKPTHTMPNLPVARVMWKAKSDFATGLKCWIYAGGAHHTVLSTAVTATMMQDWAQMMGIECVHIGEGTDVESFRKELFYNDVAWKLRNI